MGLRLRSGQAAVSTPSTSLRPGPPGLRDAKRHIVKEALWHAALELFDAQGYNRTTVEEIAEKAGVSRRTFFRYFSSKDEIVVFATDAYGDLIVRAIRQCARQGPPIEIVRAAVMCVAEFVVAQPTARRSMQIADEHLEVKAAQLSRLHQIESRIAAEFRRTLSLRDPHHPRAMALAATTLMLVDVTLRTWYRDGAMPLERIIDALIDAVRLLGADRPPAVGGRRRGRGTSLPKPSAQRISSMA
jgi:AcrR family transcriptional regulator